MAAGFDWWLSARVALAAVVATIAVSVLYGLAVRGWDRYEARVHRGRDVVLMVACGLVLLGVLAWALVLVAGA